ncbi:MAG: heliorhodopsin HeR [Candidatus Saccharibacteria bacterium]
MKLINDLFGKKVTLPELNKWNKGLAGMHAAFGALILVLSQNRSFPVTTNFLTVNPLLSTAGHPVLITAQRHLFDVRMAYVIAAFFFMSAIAHLLAASYFRKKYETDLTNGINKFRWFEYSFSASTMMIAVSFLTGVTDLSSLLMIFTLILVMNLLGLVMEVHNQKAKKVNWLSFIIGCIAGLIPWVVFLIYTLGVSLYGGGGIPTFVYFIYGTIFVSFNCFAINMYLQYKKIGFWKDYLFGEKMYMILSLVAKTLLAWQVFFGILRP